MAEEKETQAVPEQPKSGFDIKMIAIGLVIFLAAMGGSYLIAKSILSPLLPKDEKKTEEKANEVGTLVALGEFTVNLDDPSGQRFLKATIELEVTDPKMAGEGLTEYKPIIRDQINTILASKTVADMDVRNREELKKEIKNKINKKIGDKVKDVYFDQIIMQ
ncbi:MAG: flagellar basal body-associated protein FliL [Candidatus Saccharibacteria bacterium]